MLSGEIALINDHCYYYYQYITKALIEANAYFYFSSSIIHGMLFKLEDTTGINLILSSRIYVFCS